MAKAKMDIIQLFYETGLYLPTRTIYMGSSGEDADSNEDGVNYEMAQKVIKGFHILENLSSEAPIKVIMNNIGGDVIHGYSIYDTVANRPCHVTLEVKGYAMSMGAIILQAADERVKTKNSFMMNHYRAASISGHGDTVKNWTEWNTEMMQKDNKLFLDKIKNVKKKFTQKQVEELLMFDTIFGADRALDFGLIDAIKKNDGSTKRRE